MAIDIRGVCPLLTVFDMQRSIDFYTDVLGFSVARRSDPPKGEWWTLLELNGEELMLGSAFDTKTRPLAPDAARVAAHADASLFFGCPDVDSAYADLQSRGIDAEEPFVQPYGMKQLYLKDPDGYSLCLQWPA
jgi:glyoxylase I family protein